MGVKHFNGGIELKMVRGMDNPEFEKLFPGIKGKKYDGFAKLVGVPMDVPAAMWNVHLAAGQVLPVERTINYKDRPSRHECDARCMNATGRTMNCECSCGGKNHGRGSFSCEVV